MVVAWSRRGISSGVRCGLVVWMQLGQPGGLEGGFNPVRSSAIEQQNFPPTFYPGHWMLSNLFTLLLLSLASMTSGDGFVRGHFVGR